MLYLLEENTSYVVLFSSGLGLIIEFWKLTQAMSVSLDFSRGYPRLRLADKASYSCAPYLAKLNSHLGSWIRCAPLSTVSMLQLILV